MLKFNAKPTYDHHIAQNHTIILKKKKLSDSVSARSPMYIQLNVHKHADTYVNTLLLSLQKWSIFPEGTFGELSEFNRQWGNNGGRSLTKRVTSTTH